MSEYGDVLWSPSKEILDNCKMTQFLKVVGHKYLLNCSNYESLHAWSISEPELFWSACWDFVKTVGNKGYPMSLDLRDMTRAQFFPRGYCNFAENCLRREDGGPAIIFTQENMVNRSVSWFELKNTVIALARALQADGVVAGDRVCAVAANIPETVISMLAVVAIGGIWSSVSPDFGVDGILERFTQIEPKVLLYTATYYNKNKLFDVSQRIEEVVQKLGIRISIPLTPEGIQTYIANDKGQPIEFAKTNFNDPAFIMFSSGTTGKPKCIVHRHGVILQLMKEHQLHCDIKPGDKVFYYTTTTWMMWNWLVGALASEATILLFDGNPFFPTCNALFEFAHNATFFGVSAKFLDSVKSTKEFNSFPIPCVRTIASTGSPLMPEAFDFIYGKVANVNVASICGGTDILSCFILGCPIKPVKRGFAQCRGLGMDVQIWHEGKSVVNTKGELVCCTPFPSMPIGFWKDDLEQTAYRAAYFAEWPNVWKHGDYCLIDTEGHVSVYGRSDATLKPGGVRIGTAEIYRAVESLSFVRESICCGIELKPGEESVALFVVLNKAEPMSDAMRSTIRKAISDSATRHHVPTVIEEVSEIPKTHSGKIVELAVKNVIHGRPVKNMNALANPQALEEFKQFALK